MTINFNSKASYLAWRILWKIEYAQISQNIRDLKFIRKELNRALNKSAAALCEKRPIRNYYQELAMDINKFLQQVPRYLETKQKCRDLSVEYERERAHQMLETLKQAKAEAQRQYLSAKAATLVTV